MMDSRIRGFRIEPKRAVPHGRLRGAVARKYPISKAFAYYISIKTTPINHAAMTAARRDFAAAVAFFGNDRCITEIMPKDVRAHIEGQLARGLKTATVSRALTMVSAAIERYLRDHDLPIRNPFYRIRVPRARSDTTHPPTIPPKQLAALMSNCRLQDDPLRWIIALLIDTGARTAEIAGASVADFHLCEDWPYMTIEDKPWRRLKTVHSKRMVPLMGIALWAAERVVANAAPGQIHAFPQYVPKDRLCGSYSSTINQWMGRRGFPSPRSLRHTFIDRLRDIDCPVDIRRRVMGWSGRTPEAKYGAGPSIRVMAPWVRRIAYDDYANEGCLADLLPDRENKIGALENARVVLAAVQSLQAPSLKGLRDYLRLPPQDLKRGLQYCRRFGTVEVIPPDLNLRWRFRYAATGRSLPFGKRCPMINRSATPLVKSFSQEGQELIESEIRDAGIESGREAYWETAKRTRLHCSPKAVPARMWAMPSGTLTPRLAACERVLAMLVPGRGYTKSEVIARARLSGTEYCNAIYHLAECGVVERRTLKIGSSAVPGVICTGNAWKRIPKTRAIARTRISCARADSDGGI